MTSVMKESGIQDELLDIFKCFDRDGNGQVSKAELRYAVSNNIDSKISNAKVLNLFKTTDIDDLVERADTNQDGQIDYEEFVHFVMLEMK